MRFGTCWSSHCVREQGALTTEYPDISTAFRSELAERWARPKAELQRRRNAVIERKGRPDGTELGVTVH